MKKLFSFILLAATLSVIKPVSIKAQSCDTVFNLISDLDTAVLYYADTVPGTGYISGNNEYGDLAKAEGFRALPGTYVNSAILYFAWVAINPTDSNQPVTIAVWDNSGININSGDTGAPGNILDTVHVTLGQIALAVTATYSTAPYFSGILVHFHGGIAATDTIYIGVILPTVDGDTVALFTNEVSPGPDGNGWELEDANNGNGWGSYNDDWHFSGGSLGNYIIAGMCFTPDTASPLVTSFSASDTIGCAPDTVNFTDMTSPPSTNWYWSFGDGSTSTAANPTDTYLSAGTYPVTESSYNIISNFILGDIFEFYNPAVKTITIYSPFATNHITPATGASSANGDAVVSPSGGTAPYSYVWANNPSTTDSVHNVLPGHYSVTITDHNGCVYVDTLDISYTTGILQLSSGQQLKIYPNPATDVLNLVWSQQSNDEVAIIDMNGKVIATYLSTGATNNVYDVHNLPSGTYVIRITDRSSNQQQSVLFSKL